MSNTQKVEHISDIVKVLNSGVEFYSDAQDKVDNPAIASVFKMMASVRRSAIEQLQPYAAIEEGEREEGSSLAVEIRKLYTGMLAAVTSDKDHTYISQLEEVEDKTLEELKTALDKDQPGACRMALLKVYNDIKECHDKMLALQKATA
jgi:uncharacterized protein (TIGR02284 family)